MAISRYAGRVMIAVKPEVAVKLKSLDEREIWLAGQVSKKMTAERLIL
jgi:hypothetical protein